MFNLNEKSKLIVKKNTGIDANMIPDMSFDEIESQIEKHKKIKIKKTLIKDRRLTSRGSVYLFLRRLIDIKTINKKLSKI